MCACDLHIVVWFCMCLVCMALHVCACCSHDVACCCMALHVFACGCKCLHVVACVCMLSHVAAIVCTCLNVCCMGLHACLHVIACVCFVRMIWHVFACGCTFLHVRVTCGCLVLCLLFHAVVLQIAPWCGMYCMLLHGAACVFACLCVCVFACCCIMLHVVV